MTEKRYDVIDKEEPRGQSVTYNGIPCTARTCVTQLNRLTEENEQLKQFKEKVFTLIEKELEEHPYRTLTEKWNPNCKNYPSCRGNHEKNVFYASRHTLLEKLGEKLSYDCKTICVL